MNRYLLILGVLIGVSGCATATEPDAVPAPAPPSILMRANCPFWTVWTIELDGATWPHRGANVMMPPESEFPITVSDGPHVILTIRWAPTISHDDKQETFAVGDTVALRCA